MDTRAFLHQAERPARLNKRLRQQLIRGKTLNQFRNDLLDNGYLMIEFSVYARPCVTFEQMEMHIARIKGLIPKAGNARLMFMTDEQWKKSHTVIGENYHHDNRAKVPANPNQTKLSSGNKDGAET